MNEKYQEVPETETTGKVEILDLIPGHWIAAEEIELITRDGAILKISKGEEVDAMVRDPEDNSETATIYIQLPRGEGGIVLRNSLEGKKIAVVDKN